MKYSSMTPDEQMSAEKTKIVTAGDVLGINPGVNEYNGFIVFDSYIQQSNYHLYSQSLGSLQLKPGATWLSDIHIFNVCDNQLTSLEHGPTAPHIYRCNSNKLTNLKHAPSTLYVFNCNMNEITSLEGCPRCIHNEFLCGFNRLESLKDIHKHIDYMSKFSAVANPIKSHVLGLMLIDGLKQVQLDNEKVTNILNRHLGKGRAGMLQAQEELIEAGLEEFAQL